ncbi:MAG: hypothetical protein K0S74_1778 [Chlamydiales bacterium]|jgi:adenylate kinase family enzyme|nr:hypothetical protein [Chlamydiales bacterium]
MNPMTEKAIQYEVAYPLDYFYSSYTTATEYFLPQRNVAFRVQKDLNRDQSQKICQAIFIDKPRHITQMNLLSRRFKQLQNEEPCQNTEREEKDPVIQELSVMTKIKFTVTSNGEQLKIELRYRMYTSQLIETTIPVELAEKAYKLAQAHQDYEKLRTELDIESDYLFKKL